MPSSKNTIFFDLHWASSRVPENWIVSFVSFLRIILRKLRKVEMWELCIQYDKFKLGYGM